MDQHHDRVGKVRCLLQGQPGACVRRAMAGRALENDRFSNLKTDRRVAPSTGSEHCARERVGCIQRFSARTATDNVSNHGHARVSLAGTKLDEIWRQKRKLTYGLHLYSIAPTLHQMIKDVFVPYLTGIEYEGQPLEAPKPLEW